MYSRRSFLTISSALLATSSWPFKAFGSGPATGVFSPQSLGPFAQGRMTYAVFAKVEGSLFTAFLEGGQVAYLRLVKVENFGPGTTNTSIVSVASTQSAPLSKVAGKGSAANTIEGFSLQFTVQGSLTEQGTYLLDHGTLGRMALFLVPGQSSATAIVVPAATVQTIPVKRF